MKEDSEGCAVLCFLFGAFLFVFSETVNSGQNCEEVGSAPPDGEVGPDACQLGCGSRDRRHGGGSRGRDGLGTEDRLGLETAGGRRHRGPWVTWQRHQTRRMFDLQP